MALFSCAELMLLASGQQSIAPQTVVDALLFVGFEEASTTPGHLRAIIGDMAPNDLRRSLFTHIRNWPIGVRVRVRVQTEVPCRLACLERLS